MLGEAERRTTNKNPRYLAGVIKCVRLIVHAIKKYQVRLGLFELNFKLSKICRYVIDVSIAERFCHQAHHFIVSLAVTKITQLSG